MPEQLTFGEFLMSAMRDRGISLAKLSEMSGISPKYLEAIVKGDYDHFPAAPYFRGYVQTLGSILSFDPKPWVQWFRDEGIVLTSGVLDSLPENRFAKKKHGRYIVGLVVVLLLVVYAGVRSYALIGKPRITITVPDKESLVTSSDELILEGVATHADSVLINGEDAPLGDAGKFEKRVILQPGINSFEFVAKKFLGSETRQVRQVYFETSSTIPVGGTMSATSTSGTPSSTTASSTGTSSSAR